jgi:hypothetical protein
VLVVAGKASKAVTGDLQLSGLLSMALGLILLTRTESTNNTQYRQKSKAVPLHAMEAHGVRGGIAHTHS